MVLYSRSFGFLMLTIVKPDTFLNTYWGLTYPIVLLSTISRQYHIDLTYVHYLYVSHMAGSAT